MNVLDFVIFLAEKALENKGEYLRAGHNGPYHDPETPVRNYSHWLITFAKCSEWTRESKYQKQVVELAEYLISDKARPYGYSFHARDKKNKDRCNGLIGQAWALEALVEASKCLNNGTYVATAEDVFFQHEFSEQSGLWHRLEIDGKKLTLDSTFNHQLWFAACSAMIVGTREGPIKKRVLRFLECLDFNMTEFDNGLICHPIKSLWEREFAEPSTLVGKTKKFMKTAVRFSKNRVLASPRGQHPKEAMDVMWKKQVYKSIGYHSFNLYAFALLHRQFPTHPVWSSPAINAAVEYACSDEYIKALDGNIYGYAYNPPGFEIPFSLAALRKMDRYALIKLTRTWTGEQFRRCLNMKTGKMERNTEDPRTHTARVYELTRVRPEILEEVEFGFI